MQVPTQQYGRRPYGVGMLIAGCDVRHIMELLYYITVCVCIQSQGTHLYQTCPSSNYYDCKAMAIGARSQVRSCDLYYNIISTCEGMHCVSRDFSRGAKGAFCPPEDGFVP